MKKAILLILILLFASIAYATCDITDKISLSSSKKYTIKGKDFNVTFSSFTNSSNHLYVKFKINEVSTPELEKGDKYLFSDLSEITLQDITQVSTNKSAQICLNAGLSGTGKGRCSSNNDCNDNNSCTIDECDGDPLRCHHKLILWCKNNDGCCPSKCTVEKDNDCQTADKCAADSGCSSNDSLAKNASINFSVNQCQSGDSLCPKNCNFTIDKDCDECSSNENCNDNNPCTSDICFGSPKKCYNNATLTCRLNNDCIPIGTKIKDQFCNINNTMKPLKAKENYCNNNYECISNKCVKNKCKGQSISAIIKNWFSILFGIK